jgi:MinD-like ATPase involved in chromosome partitioning or flagellar assembly
MPQNRPGPGGVIRFIEPSDIVEESSKITPARTSKETLEEQQERRRFFPKAVDEKSQALVTPKPPKPKLEETLAPWIMAFKPEQKFSMAYLKWWLYTRLRLMRFEFISPPSTVVNAKAEIHENIQYLKDHRKETNAIIVVLAAKGGSAKSTIIQWLGAFIGYYVKLKPALLGMDVGADKTVPRFAADSDKVFSVVYLIELVKMHIPFTADWLQDQTETDEESGLVLFKPKPKGSGDRDFSTAYTTDMMRYMHKLYPLLFGDTGPGLNMKASDGAAQAADVALVCNKGISEEALNDIRETLNLSNYGLHTKEIKPIVVISGVLHRQLNTRTQYEVVAEKCHVDPKNVVLLPYDRYLDDQRRYNLKRVHIPALSTKTTLMLSRLAKRVVEAIVESHPANTQSAEEAARQLIKGFHSEQRTENVFDPRV